MQSEFFIADPEKMHQLGIQLATSLLMGQSGQIIYLQGALGAGKTTLVRGFLAGLGYQGKVKSPTYTIVESYQIAQRHIHHFDLYRISDPEELMYLGIADYFTPLSICIIEWPEIVVDLLPKPTLICRIQIPDDSHGRQILLSTEHPDGIALLTQLRY